MFNARLNPMCCGIIKYEQIVLILAFYQIKNPSFTQKNSCVVLRTTWLLSSNWVPAIGDRMSIFETSSH